MSGVNLLEKLLDGVAVEWTALGELTLPTTNIKWRNVNRTYRYIDLTSVNIETKTIIEAPEITQSNAPSRAQKLVEKNDVIFATTRPAQQRYCLIDDEYAGEVASTGYCVLRAKKAEVLPKWILHWIASSDFKAYIEENQSGSAYPAISDAKVKGFKIPIPCPENREKSLEIQAEIVRILDAFTELTTEITAELSAELSARKKQYNYYRDQLLSFEDGDVEWRTLSQCCNSIADGDHQAPQKTESGIPFITISDVSATSQINFNNTRFVSNSYYDGLNEKRKARTNDILYTVVGSFGIPIHIDSDKKFAFQRHIAILRPNPSVVISKYVYHALRGSNFVKQAHSVATGAAQKTITLSALNRMQIAVPPLGEQARIVAILDKFEVLTSSISEGLPHEISLRQKQYEYYRDLLLSFPTPEEVAA